MKAILLLACLLSPAAVRAQASQAAQPTPFARASGAFFAVSVADLDASVSWYSQKLGLKATSRVAQTNRMEVAVLEGGGLLVELIQNRDAIRAPNSLEANPTAVHGVFKAGLIVEDLDAALAVLRSRGVAIAYGPYPATPTQRSNAIFRDNSGNLIQLLGR